MQSANIATWFATLASSIACVARVFASLATRSDSTAKTPNAIAATIPATCSIRLIKNSPGGGERIAFVMAWCCGVDGVDGCPWDDAVKPVVFKRERVIGRFVGLESDTGSFAAVS